MAGEEYQVAQSPWRNTALPTMLWFIEAYAVFPIVLWLVDISRFSTFCLAGAMIIGLTVIRYFGLDARSAYRMIGAFMVRALANGHIRAVPPHALRRY
ncbi:MAG: hypothetical protein HC808_09010 [Candidatus Competibacteraceae bacterium]|nr:hypothetical protein [Candidatus Competibacteraceae bacterium]